MRSIDIQNAFKLQRQQACLYKQENMDLLKDWFKKLVGLRPEYIFSNVWFDPKVRKERGYSTPLRTKIKPLYDTSGCYVFFEFCNQDNEIEIMYVGSSNTLRNRIRGHWGNYGRGRQRNPIEEWEKYTEIKDYPYNPHVAIFICYNKIRDLEHWLMQLKPRFNIH